VFVREYAWRESSFRRGMRGSLSTVPTWGKENEDLLPSFSLIFFAAGKRIHLEKLLQGKSSGKVRFGCDWRRRMEEIESTQTATSPTDRPPRPLVPPFPPF